MSCERTRILLIKPAALAAPTLLGVDCTVLNLEFAEHPRAIRADEQGGFQITLADSLSAPASGFEQHELNCPVANLVIEQRIQAVVIVGLFGATLDLPRMLALLEVPVFFDLGDSNKPIAADLAAFMAQVLTKTEAFCLGAELARQYPALSQLPQCHNPTELWQLINHFQPQAQPDHAFNYSIYEFTQRNHGLLLQMQRPYVDHFVGCQRVLDLGCGSGIFVQLLKERGITAQGVERSPAIAEYGRGMGLDIITRDAIEFLENSRTSFDGIYCSHFVEHLPFDAVCRLISLMQQRLSPGGKLLLVFPDPESIRSQLLGFWRDPEHVRFYHPELICAVAQSQGLLCEWKSYQAAPHDIVPFSLEPPRVTIADQSVPALPAPRSGLRQRLRRWLGIEADQTALQQLHQRCQQQQARIAQLEHWTEQLWAVNKTWAWDDNAALRLKKHE